MTQVCGNSTLNIAATGAKDGSEGCFFSASAETWRLPVQLKGNGNLKRVICADYEMYNRIIEKAPLVCRGWVMQERLLAPGLSFRKGQVFWECRQLNVCDLYPTRIPSTIYLSIFPKEPSINNWNEIVRICSRGAFTYEKDKLVA